MNYTQEEMEQLEKIKSTLLKPDGSFNVGGTGFEIFLIQKELKELKDRINELEKKRG